MGLTTVWIDMDAYFAPAEQHLQPDLRNRPVAVVPIYLKNGTPAPTSCCIAVSYQARPSGIKTGMLVHEALRLCPDIRFVQARPTEYVRLHHDILKAVDTVLPVDRVYSIDELACRLMGAEIRLRRYPILYPRVSRNGSIWRLLAGNSSPTAAIT